MRTLLGVVATAATLFFGAKYSWYAMQRLSLAHFLLSYLVMIIGWAFLLVWLVFCVSPEIF